MSKSVSTLKSPLMALSIKWGCSLWCCPTATPTHHASCHSLLQDSCVPLAPKMTMSSRGPAFKVQSCASPDKTFHVNPYFSKSAREQSPWVAVSPQGQILPQAVKAEVQPELCSPALPSQRRHSWLFNPSWTLFPSLISRFGFKSFGNFLQRARGFPSPRVHPFLSRGSLDPTPLPCFIQSHRTFRLWKTGTCKSLLNKRIFEGGKRRHVQFG